MNAYNNLKAFLDMIAVSEGTAGLGDNGYNVLYGAHLFYGYADHPNIKIKAGGITSTAAGRYQILYRYYVSYAKLLGLTDFSPASQDKIAIRMITEQKALTDVQNGNIVSAISKVANIWASLPGAGYGQHEQKLETLLTAYKNAGGTIA